MPSERKQKKTMWETYSAKKKKRNKTKQKKKKGKLFYVFTTMTSLSAVDNLECNNAGNKSVQNCKKKISSSCQYQNKKALFADPIFREGFRQTSNKAPVNDSRTQGLFMCTLL